MHVPSKPSFTPEHAWQVKDSDLDSPRCDDLTTATGQTGAAEWSNEPVRTEDCLRLSAEGRGFWSTSAGIRSIQAPPGRKKRDEDCDGGVDVAPRVDPCLWSRRCRGIEPPPPQILSSSTHFRCCGPTVQKLCAVILNPPSLNLAFHHSAKQIVLCGPCDSVYRTWSISSSSSCPRIPPPSKHGCKLASSWLEWAAPRWRSTRSGLHPASIMAPR
jgi:hypothetical protein